MSRPAIAAGTMLAIMETLADFGTVQFFGVQTFTTGIVRTYYGLGDTIGAAQLSSLLLGFVAFLVLAERVSRHRIRYYSDRLRKLDQTAVDVRGLKAVLMQLLCCLPIFFGFLLPTAILLKWIFMYAEWQSLWRLTWNSFALAGCFCNYRFYGASNCLRKPMYPSKWLFYLTVVVGLGYALPGVVVAIGVLIPFGNLDSLISDMLSIFGVQPSLCFLAVCLPSVSPT